jgi:hypothetical protein
MLYGHHVETPLAIERDVRFGLRLEVAGDAVRVGAIEHRP